MKSLFDYLATLPRRKRRLLTVGVDFSALIAVVWALMSARYGVIYLPQSAFEALLLIAGPVLTVVVFLAFRVYHVVARYLGPRGVVRLGGCVALSTLMWGTLLLLVGPNGIPRSVVFGYAVVGSIAVLSFRLLAASLLRSRGVNVFLSSRAEKAIPVLIFGAGDLAVQLGRGIGSGRTRFVAGYLDTSPAMVGRAIDGIRIYHPDRIPMLIADQGVEEIILAVNNQSAHERRSLLMQLEQYRVRVNILPDLEEIAAGHLGYGALRGIDGRDLLGRDEVPPNVDLLQIAVAGKSILITGAGGSIGSQLSRRTLQLGARVIVLLENSEFALYQIEKELLDSLASTTLDERPKIVTVLGSVLDRALLDATFDQHEIDTVFHAAAFKHVPIVERHPAVGVNNNTFGTEVVARAAMDHCVARFVLISTDKAVCPRSVMGASKRAAELLLQKLAQQTKQTIFAAVRFGNVLGSSGSVIHRFREQIQSGGPVTVTDPNVVRYFMSLEEAANLVIQAAGLAKGGEIFTLDMGKPVKVDDLARSMIRLMGLQERTSSSPEGDIEIRYIGLRPGEKLVEDLVGPSENVVATAHPRIMKSQVEFFEPAKFRGDLDDLRMAVKLRDEALVVASLAHLVEGYVPEASLYNEANVQCRVRVIH